MPLHPSESSLLLIHGWAQSLAFWSPLFHLLTPSADLMHFDRGYFGSPVSPFFPSEKKGRVGILTHSFGLHLVPDVWLERADFGVFVSGFDTFLPQDAKKRRRSERILHRMDKKLRESPQELVALFRSLCGQEGPWSSPVCHGELLQRDLARLASEGLDLGRVGKIPEIHLVHGTLDRVVDLSRAEDLKEKLPHARLHVLENADHGLPLTHAQELARLLKGILEGRSS